MVSNEFSLWIGDNDSGFVRLGVIVTKKNIKKAAIRNQSKRFAKEMFRNIRQKFINKDIVLVVKKYEKPSSAKWKKKLQEIYLWLEHFVST